MPVHLAVLRKLPLPLPLPLSLGGLLTCPVTPCPKQSLFMRRMGVESRVMGVTLAGKNKGTVTL